MAHQHTPALSHPGASRTGTRIDRAVHDMINQTEQSIVAKTKTNTDAAPQAQADVGAKRVREERTPDGIGASLRFQVKKALRWQHSLAESDDSVLVTRLTQTMIARIVCLTTELHDIEGEADEDLVTEVAADTLLEFHGKLGLVGTNAEAGAWQSAVREVLHAAGTWSALVQSQSQRPQPPAAIGPGDVTVGGADGALQPVANPNVPPSPAHCRPDATAGLADATAAAAEPQSTAAANADAQSQSAVAAASDDDVVVDATPNHAARVAADAKPPLHTADNLSEEATDEQPNAEAPVDEAFPITPAHCGLVATVVDAIVAVLNLSRPAQRNHLLFTLYRLHTCASAVDTAQRFGIVEPAGFPLGQLFVPDSASATNLFERTLPSGSEPLVHEHFAMKGRTEPHLKNWDVARRLVVVVPFDDGRKYVAFVLRVDGFVLAVGTKARSHEDTSFDSLPAEGKVPPSIPGREHETPYFVGPTSLAQLAKRKGADRVPLWTPAGAGVSQAMLADILAPATAFRDWAAAEYELLGQKGAIAAADIPGVARLLALAHNCQLAHMPAESSLPQQHARSRSESPATAAAPSAPAPEPRPDTYLVARVKFRYRMESFAISVALSATCRAGTLVVVEAKRDNRLGAPAVDVGTIHHVIRSGTTRLPAQRVLRPATAAEMTQRNRMDKLAEDAYHYVCHLQQATFMDTDFGRADVRACEFQLDGLKLFVHFYSRHPFEFKSVAAKIREFRPIPGFYVCMKHIDWR